LRVISIKPSSLMRLSVVLASWRRCSARQTFAIAAHIHVDQIEVMRPPMLRNLAIPFLDRLGVVWRGFFGSLLRARQASGVHVDRGQASADRGSVAAARQWHLRSGWSNLVLDPGSVGSSPA
jgi:hypothetical protein